MRFKSEVRTNYAFETNLTQIRSASDHTPIPPALSLCTVE
jgi:hypothetical protein